MSLNHPKREGLSYLCGAISTRWQGYQCPARRSFYQARIGDHQAPHQRKGETKISDLIPVRLDRSAPDSAAPPKLDPDQRLAASHRGGPMLVLAGPGTGKTTTVVEAIVSAVTQGTSPLKSSQVLGLTFGRRAAEELRTRVTARIGGGLIPTVSTFHSFSYALVRRFGDTDDFIRPLRLMTGPEQDLHVRELLEGSVALGRVDWPESLRPALKTRGLSEEVRALIARARSLCLDPEDLVSLGKAHDNRAWSAVGTFLGEYLDVLDAEGVLDYTELLHRAVTLAETPDVQSQLHATYRAIYVDEYQDTDPLQVRLLRALASRDATVVVVGDPDQAIYSFRGADVGGITSFRAEFSRDGVEVPLVVLGHTRRFGPAIREAGTSILGNRVPIGFSLADMTRHRTPMCEPNPYGSGRVEVLTYDSASAQAEHIAEHLRRLFAESQADPATSADETAALAWSDMAVLVRSGVRDIGPLVRALTAAGIPTEVAGDELPLHREAAVIPLLTVLKVIANPAELTAETAHDLLTSPLIQADPAGLRRFGRTLRRLDRDRVFDGEAVVDAARPRPSAALIQYAVTHPETLGLIDPADVGPVHGRVEALIKLIAGGRQVLGDGGTPEDVLWSVWSATPWPTRLLRTALRGHSSGRRADHDLDAICALFEAAADVTARAGRGKGISAFLAELEGQWIPAQSSQENSTRGDAVRVLTAHRSKGLQWRVVVVAGVQEEAWPNTRHRGSVLDVDRLGSDGEVPPVSISELVAEERRLFYVACTRAQQHLVVTAVRGLGDDGPQPSRFLASLGISSTHVGGRPLRALTPTAVVARLRCAAVDSASSPALREAAVERLSALAGSADESGAHFVRAADPSTWWGIRDLTSSDVPVRPVDAPVTMSGSSLDGLHGCALRWFLGHEVHSESPSTSALGFGSIVHVIADQMSRGVLDRDQNAIESAVDQVWSRMAYDAPWESERQRGEAIKAVLRFIAFDEQRVRDGFTLVSTEARFDLELGVPRSDGAEERIRLTGSMDRVDMEPSRGVVVSDYKTAKNKPRKADVAVNHQLGVYQIAVREGAIEGFHGLAALGGASLVQLRAELSKKPRLPIEQPQAALIPVVESGFDDRTWMDEALGMAATVIREEAFAAKKNQYCKFCEFRTLCPAQPEGQEVI